MAIQHHHHQQQQQTGHPQNHPLLQFDALYCEEEQPQWEEDDIGVEACANIHNNNNNINSNNNNNGGTTGGGGGGGAETENAPFLPLLLLSEQDLLWDDELELVSLFSKEHEQIHPNGGPDMDPALIPVRKEAVEWMFKVVAFYGFSALTSILAINYLDRFLCSVHFQRDKPWMVQLSAVTCLSLAAKVEETQVPLLLDLQVEDTQYMFEAKTIQRMELVVLSALEWRMNLVTPLSFVGHILRRLRLKKTRLQWEFLRRCERLIVSVVADWRSVCFVPSVLATAAMLHVVMHQQQQQQQQQGGPNLNAIDYQTQLLRLLNITREEEEEEEEEVQKVNDCCQLIMEVVSSNMKEMNKKKRKCNKYDEEEGNPESPNGVIDDLSFSYEYDDTTTSSNEDDWAMAMVGGGPSVSSSFKKIRTPHF